MAKRASESEVGGLLVVKDLLKSTTADKVRLGDAEIPGSVHEHFDIHFSANYQHLATVVMWVGQVNFFGL